MAMTIDAAMNYADELAAACHRPLNLPQNAIAALAAEVRHLREHQADPDAVAAWRSIMKLVDDEAREATAYREALGLLTTLKPTLEMRPDDPAGMASDIVEYVKDRLAELQLELDTARNEAHEAANAELSVDLEDMERDLNEANRCAATYMKAYEEAQMGIANLQDDVDLKSACIQGMDERMAEWYGEVERLTAENAKVTAERDRILWQLRRLRGEVLRLRKERREREADRATMKAARDSAMAEVESAFRCGYAWGDNEQTGDVDAAWADTTWARYGESSC